MEFLWYVACCHDKHRLRHCFYVGGCCLYCLHLLIYAVIAAIHRLFMITFQPHVQCSSQSLNLYGFISIVNGLAQWFSKCGTRTTCGTWDSSSGTQRNLRIKYKSGRVHQSDFLKIVLNGSVFFMLSTRAFFSWHREFKNVSTHHCHFLVS